MKKLNKIIIGAILIIFSFILPDDIFAVTIATQDQLWNDQLSVWQAIQELGNNLSGTAQSFTFRASTTSTNLNQFDYTAQNSKIYDKDNNNSYIAGCVPPGTNPYDPTRGLIFTNTNVPPGYENVTIDFSCRNYNFNFIPGHRYLILLTNANAAAWGGKRMKLASATYSGTNNDYFTGGGARYAFDNGSCYASSYVWNSQSANNGCNIFSSAKADLYFILNNNAPPPRLPVIFIPGIGGSEMKASQDIIWSASDGHEGTYAHGYANNEKVWVNQNEAAKLGDDDYFDVLKLKADGVTPEADLSLTGNLTSFGYPDIDSFFTGMGYAKGTNFFVFPYDWRKDVRTTKDSLDALIESAKIASGQSKVNLVVHSMGGLVARYFISDPSKAAKVNKLIELGVPHLGAVDATKALMYGKPLGRQILGDFYLGVPASEVKDLFQNLPAAFQLLPSKTYFDFYNNSNQNQPYPFKDDRDIDNNRITGSLNYDQTKTLLSNLAYNMVVFIFGETLHNSLDPVLNQTNGTKIYEINGSSQPTLGQIHETWWITWPVNLIPKKDEIFINGDGTVPLYSASLKNDSLDISGATKIYYVEQKHGDLVASNGIAMQTVKAILNDDNSLPVQVKDQKIVLEGEQISLDDGELDLYDDQNRHCGPKANGEIEENIPEVTCTTSGNTKHAFVKKKAAKVKVTATRKKPATISKTSTIKKRSYRQDQISKTTIYKDIIIDEKGKIEFDLNPSLDTSPSIIFYPDATKSDIVTIPPTSEVSGGPALDQTPPTTSTEISGTKDSSGIYTGPVTITLTGNDSDSGILRTEYSLDNGQTVQTYTGPFTVSNSGETIVQIKTIDNTGNEEIPQSLTMRIAASPTSAPTSTPTPSPSNSTSSSTTSSETNSSSSNSSTKSNRSLIAAGTKPETSPLLAPSDILGIEFANPAHVPEINLSGLLNQQKNLSIDEKIINPFIETLGGLLIISGGIVALVFLGLLATFLKQIPRKM